MKTASDKLINDEALHQYKLILPWVEKPAFSKYVSQDYPTEAASTVYELTHTYVRWAMRGGGFVAVFLSFSVGQRQKDHKAIPSWWYIWVYMMRHPHDKNVLLV